MAKMLIYRGPAIPSIIGLPMATAGAFILSFYYLVGITLFKIWKEPDWN